MKFLPFNRAPDAFQQSINSDQIKAICHRIFGSDTEVISAIELGNGMYNNTYRIDIDDHDPVILRVAPKPAKQYRIERELMRNEYASIPFFAPISTMVPRIVAADFTQEIIERDFVIHTMLPGFPGPEGLNSYPRSEWLPFFREVGSIARRIHSVRGNKFSNKVNGPWFDSWAQTLTAYFVDLAADLAEAKLDSTDIRELLAVIDQDQRHFAQITEPQLLHGDLWTANVMMSPNSPEPKITGVFDNDRTSWGDPLADWPIFMANQRAKSNPERIAFWQGYGQPRFTTESVRRSLFYRAKHIGAIRLERHRLGDALGVRHSYQQMKDLLDQIKVY